jgi:ABC-2 type transport system permease protein
MSALVENPAASSVEPASDVTLGRVIRSEWTKLWSLRSTRWSLLIAVLAQIGLGLLFAAITMAQWNHLNFFQRLAFHSIDRSIAGYHLAQLAIGVLGVLVISGEYGTGQIRSSLLAVPKRLPVLWAKLLVFGSVTFVLILISALISFFGAQAIFTEHHVNVAIGAPDALRSVIGAALYLTVTAVICTALGTIIRSTAGAISAYVGLLFVLPGVVALLPTSIDNSVSPYLPINAGTTVASAVNVGSGVSSTWGGFAFYCGYAAVLVLVAAMLLKRRDA